MSAKTFEDFFSEIQANMVSLALDYVNQKADEIYLYASNDGGVLFFDVFYKIKGEIIARNKLNELDNNYDVSVDRQVEMLKIGMNDLKEIRQLFKDYNMEMPTEMKMVYIIETGNFEAKYDYNPIHSNSQDLTPDMIFSIWFNELKNKK